MKERGHAVIEVVSLAGNPPRSSHHSRNHKEDAMSMTSMLTVGFLSLMAATAVVSVSDGFAAETHRVDVIETSNETVAQPDSRKGGDESMRVDVIDHVGPEGSMYPYTKSISH
jgi:hypothetical protein